MKKNIINKNLFLLGLPVQGWVFLLFFLILDSVLFFSTSSAISVDAADLWYVFFVNILLYAFFVIIVLILGRGANNFLFRMSGRFCLLSFAVFYIFGWIFRFRLDYFPDETTLKYIVIYPVQLFKHLTATDIKELIFASVLIALLVVFLEILIGFRKDEKRRQVTQQSFLSQAFILIFVCFLIVIFPLSKTLAINPQTRIIQSLYSENIPYPQNSELEVLYRPIESDKQYLMEDQSAVKKHSIIMLVVESLAIDVDQMKSVMPNVYGLAQNAAIFPNTFSTSTHSGYAGPSIFSGQYPLRSYRDLAYRIEHNKIFIYDILKRLNYSTGYISAQDENWSNMKRFIKTPNLDYFIDSTSFSGKKLQDTHGFKVWARRKGSGGKVDDKYVIDEAIGFIERKAEQPYFLGLDLQRSHFPYTWPAEYKAPFSPIDLDFRVVFGNYPVEKVEIMKNRYYNSLNYIDSQIGRLLDLLKEKNLYEDMIIVITGDTGQGFYEHGVCCHGTGVYNEIVKTPLIIKFPEGQEQQIHNDMLSHIDIVPTILGYMSIPIHPAFQGRDVLNERDARPVFVVSHFSRFKGLAVIDDGYKYIIDMISRKEYLFNLLKDPLERNDLVGKNILLRNQLRDKLLDWNFTQIQYYNNEKFYRKYFPPKYR